MNALELIKRIEAMTQYSKCSSGDYDDCKEDIIELIKQMEKEKWESALIDHCQWSNDGII